jgi:MYXO-CTERM domain-containing protein
VIDVGETMTSENCGPCSALLAGGETTVSESDVTCFDRLTKWWWDAGEGLEGHHWYTITTDAAQADTIGRWRFVVSVPGNYEIAIHVPEDNAQATGATYHVHHAGQVASIGLDQATQKSWQSLGVFEFDGSADQFVELPDNTGEAYALMHPLAFDSVRFTYVAPGDGDGDSTTGDGDGDSTTDGDCPIGAEGCPCTPGGGCDPGLACSAGVCEPQAETSGAESETDDGLDDVGGDDADCLFDCGPGVDRGDEACSCSSKPEPLGLPASLGLLVVLARRRRRG